MYNYYNKNLRGCAHDLRTNSISRAEKYLWKVALKQGKTGVKFKRQRPIHHFIVDFFAQEIGLIIEVDGSSHLNKIEYDFYRQQKLESLGYTILRFTEGSVLNDINNVMLRIEHSVYVLRDSV